MSIAVLDACVLYPPALRDLFLWLAEEGVYRPRWTDAIYDEWTRNLLADRPNQTAERLARTRELMNQVDPLCLVTGYEAAIAFLRLPDPDDRHVLAAAIHANAAVIVTFNRKDFPASALAPFGIAALSPDVFLCGLLDAAPELFLRAVEAHRLSLNRPPKTTEEYHATLRQNGLPQLAARLSDKSE